MYDTIYDLVKSEDLLEANRLLKMIDNALTSQSITRSNFCRALSQAVIEWSAIGRYEDIFAGIRPEYHIYSASNAIPPYLASYGLALGKVRETRKNIRLLIADIDNTVIKPSGISMSLEDEEQVLSTLSNKFPFFLEIISANKTLNILNINNTHRLFNSMCGVSENAASFVVYMFNMKDCSIAPEYVFLHELGHVLQIALTGSDLLVPNEFIDFNNSLPKVNLEQGTYDAVEAFADTFAIAVMHGTSLCGFNPFPFY